MKLNQVIAVEKGIKNRSQSTTTTLHRDSQKAEKYSGYNKTWEKKDDAGEEFSPESKRVQLQVDDVLDDLSSAETAWMDIVYQKDRGNQEARADVVVNGTVVVADAPATFLIFLEKRLDDVHTFVSKLPTLDDAEEWKIDETKGLFVTDVQKTHRTKKVPQVIVKYDATPEHPAQTELVTLDEIIGYWNLSKMSGAMPAPRKKEILKRVVKLQLAVKRAREQANMQEVTKYEVGENVFSFLFA